MCDCNLVLIEVSDDDAHEQRESDHTAQEHKDMDVDAMDLQTHTDGDTVP